MKLLWTEEVYRIHEVLPSEYVPTVESAINFYSKESRPLIARAIQRAITQGEPFNLELQIVTATGKVLWVQAIGEAVINKQPRPGERSVVSKIFGTFQDIHERKLALEAQKHLAEIVEKSLNEIYVFDAYTLKFKHANHGALKNLQYTLAEIKTLTPVDIKPDYTEESFRQAIAPLLQHQCELLLFESNHRRADGSLYPVEVRLQLVDVDGIPRNKVFLAVISDITNRKKAEFDLMAEKERLNVTLQSIGDGVITSDLQGKVEIINRVAQKLTGWTQEEAYGKPLSEVFYIINEITRHRCQNPVEQVLQSGEVIELSNHTCLISRDGRELVMEDSGAPIRDKQNNIIGVVLVFRDNTEKQKLKQSEEKTAKLEALGILAGGIAHDFNNLLGGIFGHIEMARESIPQENKAIEFIDKAMTTFNRAKALTEQLLTFAKGGEPVKKILPIAPLLQASTHFAMSGSNVLAVFDIAANLWPLRFDENQIGQVIDNIVINAIQAMPLGGKLTIAAQNVTLKEVHYVQISFADTGSGIPSHILSRIFDPFFTTKSKGSGLGLATVYSIVKKHNGEITVESHLEKGTTFYVLLPAIATFNQPQRQEQEEQPMSTTPDSRSDNDNDKEAKNTIPHGCILVMEDEIFLREIIEYMLTSIGYRVQFALNGEEALKLIKEAEEKNNPFVAAIMDLTIPGAMGGKDAILKLRERGSQLKVFVSSGYSDDPVMANPEKYGFNDKISKPFRKAELEALLKKI
ncbi:MAG: PAS domain S-box protein [Oligoflexia bacterium]|nr:PAS domain S-box protein [Oligoflexia bacterium]